MPGGDGPSGFFVFYWDVLAVFGVSEGKMRAEAETINKPGLGDNSRKKNMMKHRPVLG